MLKLEKIITLFNLFYTLKHSKAYNNFSNFKIVKPCLTNLNRRIFVKNFSNFLSNRFFFFFITSDLSIKNMTIKSKLHFCVKLQLRIIIVSIYFKKTLMVNVIKSLKKRVRNKKRVERLYKAKGLVYGIKRVVRWNKWIHKKNIRKKKLIKRVKKSLFKFIFKSLLKLIYSLNVTNVYVYFFKSNKYIKKRGVRRVYLKRKHKFYKKKIFKKIRKLFFLKFFKNIKFNIIFSSNFSHSKKFLKLKKRRA